MSEKKRVIITGGSGMVGRRLSQMLREKDMEPVILSRKSTDREKGVYHWDPVTGELDTGAFQNARVLVHLAGANVGEKPWSADRKREIIDSRVNSTRLLINTLQTVPHTLDSVISASAVGYYGNSGTQSVNESSPPGNDFLAETTTAWEKATTRFSDIGLRTVRIRIGVVLSPEGGALPKMALPVKLFAGSPLGNGRQYLPWIHIDDLCRLFIFAMENEIEGIYNGVAPLPVDNREMTVSLGRVLHRPILLPNVPAFVLRLVLGQMSEMVLNGQNASSKKIEDAGFTFQYGKLEDALKNIYHS